MFNNNRISEISGKKALGMYSLVSLFLFFEMAIQVSPSVMSHQLMSALNIGSFSLGIMSGCYFYTYTAMQVPSGMLFDRFEPRIIIFLAIIICILGNSLLGIANTLMVACLARLLVGFGSAFAFVSVLIVTADLFAPKYFATITGVTQMLAALGAMSGQLPTSLLVQMLDWRVTVFVFSVIGSCIALGVLLFLRYDKDEFQLSGSKVDSSPFYTREVFLKPQTWFVALYAFLLWAPMSGFASLWGVPFLMHVKALSAGKAAFLCSLMWFGLAVASPMLGYISTRIENRKLPLVISALIGVIAFGLVLFFKLSEPSLFVLLLFAGAACSGQALSFTVVKENNLREVRATAIAFNNMAVVISGAVFQPLIGWLLGGNEFGDISQFRISLSVILIAYAVAFLISVCLIQEPSVRSVEK